MGMQACCGDGVSVCVSFTLFCMTEYVGVAAMHYYAIDFCVSIYAFRAFV